jgi:hypothetical protein
VALFFSLPSGPLTTRALACSSRAFIGPDETQYVWKSKDNRLEVRIYSAFYVPFEIKDVNLSDALTAVVRQERAKAHGGVWFEGAFACCSRARSGVLGTRCAYLPGDQKTEKVFAQSESKLHFFPLPKYHFLSSPRSVLGASIFPEFFLRLIVGERMMGVRRSRLRMSFELNTISNTLFLSHLLPSSSSGSPPLRPRRHRGLCPK